MLDNEGNIKGKFTGFSKYDSHHALSLHNNDIDLFGMEWLK